MTQRLRELILLFGKLGIVGFGGPAVHIGMMEDEIVERRQWMTHDQFLDLVGATNLIPGPNSTEMTMHVGYHRAGFLGLITAGTSFIVPAVITTGLLAWFYVTYGALPTVEPFMAGIKPAVLAVILAALLKLSQKALTHPLAKAIAIAAIAASFLGLSEITLILTLGIIGMFILLQPPKTDTPDTPTTRSPAFLLPLALTGGAATATAAAVVPATLTKLGWVFLKVGLVLYGSGYVLFAFLEGDLVDRYHWLTNQQLLDAIAIGQFTPGPILSTSTFVGYQVLGWQGAMVATLCMFLPSFLYVAIAYPLIPKLRSSRHASAFLDAVNAAALGLMAAVLLKLTYQALLIPRADTLPYGAWIIAALAIIANRYAKLSSVYIIIAGALLGALCHLIHLPV